MLKIGKHDEFSGATWEYLSEGRQQNIRTCRPSTDETHESNKIRLGQTDKPEDFLELVDSDRDSRPCSELELHTIKVGCQMISSLWRDVSMGADQVSLGALNAIHKELGEIGSELFSRIFLSQALPRQVDLIA